MGSIEVECEGSEEFLKKELADLLATVSRLHRETGSEPEDAVGSDGNSGVVGTTATVAGKLGAKSGNDLVIAAAAHLTFVADKAEFSRDELRAEVQGASGYFRDSYNKNLTNYLGSRVKAGQLVESKKGRYALSAKEKSSLQRKLAS